MKLAVNGGGCVKMMEMSEKIEKGEDVAKRFDQQTFGKSLTKNAALLSYAEANFRSSSTSRTSSSAIFSITGSFDSSDSNLKSTASNLESIASNLESTLASIASNFVIISFLKLATPFSTASMRVYMAFISPVISFSFGRSSLSIQPGIFSMIKYLPHWYIKHFLSEERTCAKKGNLLTLTSCEDARCKSNPYPASCIRHKKEKQNMSLAKKFDTWCKSTKGLRMEGKKEEVKEEENKRRGARCVVSGA